MNQYEDKNVARVIERAMKITTQRELAQDLAFLLAQTNLREDAQDHTALLEMNKKYGWKL